MFWVALWVSASILATEEPSKIYTSPPLTSEQREAVIRRLQVRWEQIQKKPERMFVGELFAFALECAEADWGIEHIDEALALAERMQDRNHESRTFGNFRWYWGAERPEDLNAVEFSMRDAALLWMRHHKHLPSGAKERLERLIRFGIEGILRHNVSVGYTNIFLMKTWNCIALGENFGRTELARRGYGMLDAWLLYTYENGIREYLSPTYYGVDLDCLILIARFSQSAKARRQAETAIRLFWEDIAANWFEPCQRLGGAHSRDYDYLIGRGALDEHLRYSGWLSQPMGYLPSRYLLLAGWKPSEALKQWAAQNVPRFVRQRWGSGKGEWASHWVGRSISLGVAGACYGPEDKIMTLQFSNGPDKPMGYIFVDARNDPYGKKREVTPGGHMKSWHPEPFVSSVHKGRDALMLIATSPEEPSFKRRIPQPLSLATHFVFPREGTEVWLGEQRNLLTQEPGSTLVPLRMPIFIRYKDAAVGVKVVYALDLDGQQAQILLVNDGNPYGVMRLSIVHSTQPPTRGSAVAAIWVRVSEGMDEGGFAHFRERFAQEQATVRREGDVMDISVPGEESPLHLRANIVTHERLSEELETQEGILYVNGRETGQVILREVEPVITYHRLLTGEGIPMVLPEQIFEAENAPLILFPFEVGKDTEASSGQFIWVPGASGGQGSAAEAKAFFLLQVPKAGQYFLWARVQTPTPEDDSFFFRLRQGRRELLPLTEWHTGVHTQWEWVQVELGKPGRKMQKHMELPAGTVILEIVGREDGAKIDCLLLTAHEKKPF
ncbi:MAG: hypothetical protein RMK18_11965 [Armatimonadota bacterium]|nr:hypothetical protein [Armatimonadota bacterium]MDW8026563.1 hypothetical protein [Armatimonadota bacterium]